MTYRHLDDGITELSCGTRNESVHASKLQRQGERDLSLHHAERTSGVSNRIAKQPPSGKATHDRRNAPNEIVLAGGGAIALNQVGAMLILTSNHRGDVRGVVLQIAIDRNDQIPPRRSKPCMERSGLSVAFTRRCVQHADRA